ncbi:alkaline phosphatase family protein [Clostridium formicaceticum]|uniref:2,3-bisphosphoglycerate-independent phosphoglycerate mutase n=1 Tax=Clostridium formicaceticum TaxID=1497 RepID=A0AAC9WGE9_9CLOT|nr:alkaline phosphatase family protein [Clostridium formicaceticum]AOY76270.1 hypothetical protein BJL90_10370 [Clostridium formicaceticum]ARE86655.1 2,3-bisphosphoglycerate-independent phosphoglycerate mutase [Clostridium formicaceticum]
MKENLAKYSKLLLVILFINNLMMGCSTTTSGMKSDGYIPSFKIIGDVEEVLTVRSMEDFSLEEVEIDGEKKQVLKLEELLYKAKPVTESIEILLVGQDGLMAKIDGERIETCYINLSAENAWEFINPSHPISSNIKKVKEVVVIAKEEDWDYGFNLITSEENIMNITAGQMYTMPRTVFPYFQGTSSIDTEGHTYETTIYTEEKIIKLKDLIDLTENDRLLAMGDLGQYKFVDGDSYLKMVDNRIDLLEKEGKDKITDARGVIINPPQISIMDTYYDASHFLAQDEKVLILFLDGFGYHQYLHAIEKGYAPFLKELALAEKATSVYQSVTNAGFAAMITGKSPYENGVYSRSQRDLKVPSIFAVAKDLNKKSVLIEGDIKILNTEIEPLLNRDENNNGITCDEVFETALEHIDTDYDLMFIHFHGIDDMGHSYGDFHETTMKMIKETDNYARELVENWEGKVIITSDHGMHSTPEALRGGNHGSFRYQDMIVPYIVTEGRGRN